MKMYNIYDYVLQNNFVNKDIHYSDLLLEIFPNLSKEILYLWTFKKRIVFWIKKESITGKIENEFYIYNDHPEREFLDVEKIISRFNTKQRFFPLEWILENNFMYSWTFNDTVQIEYLDFYFSKNHKNYRLQNGKIEERNYYSFFWKKEYMKVENLLLAYISWNSAIKKMLYIFSQYVMDTWTICIADKKERWIWIYLNRIDMEWFKVFLNVFKYPENIKTFFLTLEKNDLNIDISFDIQEKNGKYFISKTWFYGVF